MKQLSAALETAMRHRQWHWCRRPNGFSVMAKWKRVAARLGMPPFQVIAFVNWLEEVANGAETRGQVGDFSAADCAVDLGMAEEDAARIFVALEEPDVGWIADDYVADFNRRNPDREDETAGLRKRRQRARIAIRKALVGLTHTGTIDGPMRTDIERRLMAMPDPELFATVAELQQLAAYPQVTRETVTVTPEQSIGLKPTPVDNLGDGASGESAGLSEGQAAEIETDPQAKAELWLNTEGRRIVVVRTLWKPTLAATRIERWWRDAGCDYAVLAEIIRRVGEGHAEGSRFEALVDDGVKRHAEQAANGPQLGLMPPNPSKGRSRPAEETGELTAALARLETIRKAGGGHG